MARQTGANTFAGTLEPLAGGPLDARSRVPLKTDLTTASNFPYPYEGMKVYVIEEKKTYTLIGNDVTVLANWQEDGTGGGGTGGGHVIEDNGTALTQRDTLNFVGFDAEDDSTNSKTQIAEHELTQDELAEIMSTPPGPSVPTDFDDLANRPTVDVTSMSEIITPVPSVGVRRFKYSTDEQIVGEWIDGKPMYQKTISCGALPNNTIKTVEHNISNLGNVISYSGWATDGSTKLIFPFPSSSNIANNIAMTVNATVITIQTGANRSSYTTSYVTLQYTKTTD